ncbi:MAG: hypothetical protein KDD06_05080 [Phaeodactylibacter sp.]|nr:hypothetical protein [Phaeodactylibacter sp.]MCB9264068.1 hypothetical protein [Lewinellaceae bacterium]MCB9289857.1 hypothetical protein [Lewinellaceae bacterium]
MEDLNQLIGIVSPNKVKNIELVFSGRGEGSNLQRLYRAIAEADGVSEEELIPKFFTGKNRKEYFNRLKRELKGRLVNTLFLIDANDSKYSEVARAYYNCYKNSAAIKILLARGARQVAVQLAEETMKAAERFEFTDILLSLAKDLRFHYGTILGDSEMFRHYNKKAHHYSQLYLMELKAEEYYTALALTFSVSRASKVEFSQDAARYAEEMEQLLREHHSYRFNLYAFTVIALRYEMANDHELTIATCQRALNYFENKEHLTSRQALFNFSFRMLSSYILLRRLDEGKKLAMRCLQWVDKGLFNWYRVMEFLFILYLHSEEYEEACEICREVVGHESFSKQYSAVQESWYIYEAYAYYFISMGIVEVENDDPLRKFRLSRFLNEVPTFSKDKKGKNISILILQVLFLLQQQQFGKIIDRMESLRTYTHRYLRRDETFRSNCFIKMLMQLPASAFHKAAVVRKSKKYWEKLRTVGIINNQSADLEAVPYETLWQFVLKSLDEK